MKSTRGLTGCANPSLRSDGCRISGESQSEHGKSGPDGSPRKDVGRVVQPQHDARAGDEGGKGHKYPGELGKVHAGLPGERDRMQRVPGREAVAIERRRGEIDALMGDERAL